MVQTMSLRSWVIGLLLPTMGWAEPCSDDSQREAYRQMTTLDQQPRLRLADWLARHGSAQGDPELAALLDDMRRSDARVQELLLALWDRCGRPAGAALSRENVEAVLLVALHADLDIQSRLIEFLRDAAGRGLVGAKQMATLEERFNKRRAGRPAAPAPSPAPSD